MSLVFTSEREVLRPHTPTSCLCASSVPAGGGGAGREAGKCSLLFEQK